MINIISYRNIIGFTLLYINRYLSIKLLWNFLWSPLIKIVQATHEYVWFMRIYKVIL